MSTIKSTAPIAMSTRCIKLSGTMKTDTRYEVDQCSRGNEELLVRVYSGGPPRLDVYDIRTVAQCDVGAHVFVECDDGTWEQAIVEPSTATQLTRLNATFTQLHKDALNERLINEVRAALNDSADATMGDNSVSLALWQDFRDHASAFNDVQKSYHALTRALAAKNG